MKRTLFSVIVALAVSFAFAQEKNVKEAKRIASNQEKPDFGKAESLITPALTNPETKDMAETWDVAGFVQKRINEELVKNMILKKDYDKLKLYNSLYDACQYYLKCDELAQIPNEKGKIKNKYRKANTAFMLQERPNLMAYGIELYNMDKSKEALKFFGLYIDLASQPMLAETNLQQTDTLMATDAYYACLAASRDEDYASIIKYGKYAQADKENGQHAAELVASAYKSMGDTIQWVQSLKDGLLKYPDDKFFFGNLIDHYSAHNQYDEAIKFADDMLAKSPNDAFLLYVEGYLYYNIYIALKSEKKEQEATAALEKADSYYTQAIAADPSYADAYSNLGLVYLNQAQDYSEKAVSNVNDPNYKVEQETLRSFYEKAKTAYEKARELKPDQKNLWMQGLYRVYYNLDLGDQFAEIEKLMNGGQSE